MTTPFAVLASALAPSSDAVEAQARLARLVALPRRIEGVVGRLGSVALTVCAAERDAPEGPSFGLVGGEAVGGLLGRLTVDSALARRLVARGLGVEGAGELAVRRLGLAERGLVAGLVAAALRELGAPLVVSLVAPEPEALRASGALAIDLDLDLGGARGVARIDAPATWLARRASAAKVDALAELSIEATVVRARTRLPARELAALGPGDVVVFEGEASALVESWPASLVVGGYEAPLAIEPSGATHVRGAFRSVGGASSEALAESGGGASPTRSVVDRATDATVTFASVPVEVVAELARLSLRGDEVLAVDVGATLGLAGERGRRAALRVGRELRAEGDLVDVGGALGLRVGNVVGLSR
jgi:type III secretion protein Q